MDKYIVMMRMENGVTVSVMPSHVSVEEAAKQVDDLCSAMSKFPGGTQSVAIWAEVV